VTVTGDAAARTVTGDAAALCASHAVPRCALGRVFAACEVALLGDAWEMRAVCCISTSA